MPLSERPNALQPCWFWMAVVQLLETTGIQQNQLLHIRIMELERGLCITFTMTHLEITC